MKIYFFIACFFIVIEFCSSQTNTCPDIENKNALRLLNEASSALKYSDKESSVLLLKAIKLEPDFAQAYFILGQINYTKAIKAMNDINLIRNLDLYFTRAENYFIKVTEICPQHEDFLAFYYLGMYYYNLKQYEQSKKYLDYFVTNTSINDKRKNISLRRLKNCNTYFELINNPVEFEPASLEGVCTSKDEFLPLVTPDGEFVLYTQRYISKEKDELTESEKEVFTISYRSDTSGKRDVYSEGVPMPYPFNDGRNQGAVSITIDNNHLFITICEFTSVNHMPYKNCDIYTSDFVNGRWSELKNLGENVNGESTWEGQPSVTADGKMLYFASAREDSYGGIDLYRSRKKTSGKWSKAENLGDVINTSGNDKSPFIHSDSHTLYFSSDGRFGMGGYDIYFTKLQRGDSWSEPQNIGYPVNTKNDDVGFIVSTNGQKAYFSSNKFNGKGGWDIYTFKLHKEAQPNKVLFVKGHLVDNEGKVLIDAKVELKSTRDNRKTEALVDRLTGKYAVAVSAKEREEFIMTVKKPDFTFTSRFIKVDEINDEEPEEIDIEVKPIEVGINVKIHNIYFAFNSDVLDTISTIVLDNFTDFLVENTNVKIRVEGHTDNIDDDAFNMDLSRRRAKAVYNYLLLKGIDKNRLAYKGYGETRPVATNTTEEGRALNRRTEFVITDK